MKSGWGFHWKGEMTITVYCQLMTVLMDLPDDVWVMLRTVSNQKERRAHLMLFQHIQQARRIPRVRAIVKRQRDLGPGRVAVEQDLGIMALGKIIETRQHFSIIIALYGKWQTSKLYRSGLAILINQALQSRTNGPRKRCHLPRCRSAELPVPVCHIPSRIAQRL